MNQRADLEREHDDLKLKFIEGAKERKELYNKVLELKGEPRISWRLKQKNIILLLIHECLTDFLFWTVGNIRVFCRCRPLNAEETATGASAAIDFESAKDGELVVKASGAPKKVFKFDSVFSPQADQGNHLNKISPLILNLK